MAMVTAQTLVTRARLWHDGAISTDQFIESVGLEYRRLQLKDGRTATADDIEQRFPGYMVAAVQRSTAGPRQVVNRDFPPWTGQRDTPPEPPTPIALACPFDATSTGARLRSVNADELREAMQPGWSPEYACRYIAGGPTREPQRRSYWYVDTDGRPPGAAQHGYSRTAVRSLTQEIPYDTGRGLDEQLHGELIRRFSQQNFRKAIRAVWEAKSDFPRVGCETWRDLEAESWIRYQAKRHVLWPKDNDYVYRALENRLRDARRVGSNRERIYQERLHGIIMNFKKFHRVTDLNSLYYGERNNDGEIRD